MLRPSWNKYFLDLAKLAATRSTCGRKQVGCVLVRDKRVIATGYNGSLPDKPHCDDVGHMLEHGRCTRTVHAEANAVLQAARFGISTDGCVAFCTTYPCWSCAKILVGAGIAEVVVAATGDYYNDPRVTEVGLTVIRA